MRSGVYAIQNERTGEIYIGSSATIKRRWRQHRSELDNGNHRAKHLGNSWKKYGPRAFRFFVLQSCPPMDLLFWEQRWIDALHPAFNQSPTAGSVRGIRRSQETRTKLSLQATGRPAPKGSPWSKGYVKSPTHRAKLAEAKKGTKHLAESRAKMSETHRLRYAEASDEWKATRGRNISIAKKAAVTDEFRRRMRSIRQSNLNRRSHSKE